MRINKKKRGLFAYLALEADISNGGARLSSSGFAARGREIKWPLWCSTAVDILVTDSQES